MKGTPSTLAPKPEWMPQSAVFAAPAAQAAFSVAESLTPVKQNADAGPLPQEACMELVLVGLSNFSWPSRKYVNRASLTEVEPMVEVWLTLICWVRVA